MIGISTTARILIAASLLTGGCARAPKHETDLEAVRAEILAIENQWATAIERQDAAAFERLAAEDFRFIDENGRVLNRGILLTGAITRTTWSLRFRMRLKFGNMATLP
jgi:hypothetical protein